MRLELQSAERGLMLDVLKGRMGELRQEIHHSTVSTFTDKLKEMERLLTGIIDKLEPVTSESDGR